MKARQETEAVFPRMPHRLHFRSPAGPIDWRMTGNINWPSALDQRYEAPPTCEWVNGEGDKIWLPSEYENIVSDIERRTGHDFVERVARWGQALLGLVPRSSKTFLNPTYATLCYLHLVADVGC